MKKLHYILFLLGAVTLAACTEPDDTIEFGLDQQTIDIDANGGIRTVKISSSESWIAITDNPWISVSPANGRGSTECQIIIDSALTDIPRKGLVTIRTQQSMKDSQLNIEQAGYQYRVELDKNDITVPNYAAYGQRYFDVVVRTNAEFDIRIPDDAGWLSYEAPKFNFDKGVRPREVNVRFNWQISSQPERFAEVKFTPRTVEASHIDNLVVTQEAAPKIEIDTRAGDSVALLGIARSLDTWRSWESSDPMEQWEDVVLWEDWMDGYTEDKAGRVKRADFFMFGTKEGLPYEVQYLTAAEELVFRGNTNSFLYDLDPGEYISKLTNLKKLTIMGYGLSTLSQDFTNMKSLEYLDLSANNFENFPTILRKENFPNLKQLVLNANQRVLVYDISNYNRANMGGFYAATTPDSEFPRWLLEWDTLESLVLGVNYLQGHLPTLEDDPSWTSFYTEQEVMQTDSLPRGRFADKNEDGSPRGIVGLPKVWPKMMHFTINYNRMTGTLPDWLLYHPALDWWIPFTFVFAQEGKDETGVNAGFTNEPSTTMDYYYNFYPHKQNPYGHDDDREDSNKTIDKR